MRKFCLQREYKAYHDLINDGGLPTHHPDNSTAIVIDTALRDIRWYWTCRSASNQSTLQSQQHAWELFREHQDWRRWTYWKPEWFDKFVQELRDYREKQGLLGHIDLLYDRKQQSKLQDWIEYQYWQYRKADTYAQGMIDYAEKKKKSEEELRHAIEAGEPAEEIWGIQEYGVDAMEGKRGTAELELEQQTVLLRWIDEQIESMASEDAASHLGASAHDSPQSVTANIRPNKRKRSSDDTSSAPTKRSKPTRNAAHHMSHATAQPTPPLDTHASSPTVTQAVGDSTALSFEQHHTDRSDTPLERVNKPKSQLRSMRSKPQVKANMALRRSPRTSLSRIKDSQGRIAKATTKASESNPHLDTRRDNQRTHILCTDSKTRKTRLRNGQQRTATVEQEPVRRSKRIAQRPMVYYTR